LIGDGRSFRNIAKIYEFITINMVKLDYEFALPELYVWEELE